MKTTNLLIVTAAALLVAVGAAAQPHGHRGPGKANLWPSLAADFDQNQDGQITLDEFGGAEATFEKFDSNDDGVVTADDFAGRGEHRWSERHGARMGGVMAGGLFFRIADADDDGVVTAAELDTFLAAADANGDGEITREELHAAASADGSAPGLPRGPRFEGDVPPHPLDRDQDGIVEVEDFRQIFADLDANGDGQLSSDEVPRFRDHFARGGPRDGRPRHPLLVHHADADENGEVTTAEWQTFLSELDADGSGVIDAAEWLAALPHREGHEPPPDMFERLTAIFDRNDNGTLEVSDFNAVFNELDSDGDGVIEAEELPRHRFRHRA